MKSKKSHKFIIQVAPLIRLPAAGTQIYSYLWDKYIPVGALVSVPFFRRNLEGIVVSSKKDFPRKGGLRLKRINSVIQENFLVQWQIDFAKNLSEYYLSGSGVFLKMMVPKISAEPKKKDPGKIKKIPRKKIPFSETAKAILGGKKNKILVIGPAKERVAFMAQIVSGFMKSKKQCLILVPEIYQSLEMKRRFGQFFPENEIALFHGKMPKGLFFAEWARIKNGKTKIAIATKLGVFLPFLELGGVIVEEEQDISHKQWDKNPRHNAARAAEILADFLKTKLILGSASPAVETFWKAKKENWQVEKTLETNAKKTETEIVDLFPERNAADFPISKNLYSAVSETLDRKKKILLLAKRRGYSNFSVCQGCKSTFRCPNCKRALVYFEEKDGYRCLHCSFKADIFSACPKCGGHRFSHKGVGAQLVEKKIKRMFPAAKVARLDADSVKNVKKYEEFSQKMDKGEIDIVVGTQMALKLGGFFDFGLVAVVSAHDFLNIPDFNSDEQALSNFVQAKNMLSGGGKFIIQTFSPREKIFEYAVLGEYQKFFENEIRLRKKLDLPPFSRLVKLSFRDIDKKKVEKDTQKIFDLISATGDNKIEATAPYEPLAAKKRSLFYRNILIKAKFGKNLRDLPLYPVIGGLRKGWTVDVDPISTV